MCNCLHTVTHDVLMSGPPRLRKLRSKAANEGRGPGTNLSTLRHAAAAAQVALLDVLASWGTSCTHARTLARSLARTHTRIHTHAHTRRNIGLRAARHGVVPARKSVPQLRRIQSRVKVAGKSHGNPEFVTVGGPRVSPSVCSITRDHAALTKRH